MLKPLLIVLLAVTADVSAKCSDHTFLGCMLRLKTQRVPIEKNIFAVVFQIKTEARLLHTCKAYSAILPCFQEIVNDCGDEKQHRMLNEVSKMLQFICSPFSLKRQRQLIQHQSCISNVLSLPAATGCSLEKHEFGREVLQCKSDCSARGSDFICMMRTWISEQNTCTMVDLKEKCGDEAANLYKDMQNSVFEPMFPVICGYGNETTTQIPAVKKTTKKRIKQQKVKTTTTTTTTTEPTATTTELQITKYHKPIKSQKAKKQQAYVVTTSVPMTTTPMSVTETVQWMNQYPENHYRPNYASIEQNYIPDGQPKDTRIWTKGPSTRLQYNKEVWKQRGPDFYFTTQHPLFTTNFPGATPRSHKVIDILKSLIPENLPLKLTSFLESNFEKPDYSEFETFNTPPAENFERAVFIPETQSYAPYEQMQPEIYKMYPNQYPEAQAYPQEHQQPEEPLPNVAPFILASKKWKPWYLENTRR